MYCGCMLKNVLLIGVHEQKGWQSTAQTQKGGWKYGPESIEPTTKLILSKLWIHWWGRNAIALSPLKFP